MPGAGARRGRDPRRLPRGALEERRTGTRRRPLRRLRRAGGVPRGRGARRADCAVDERRARARRRAAERRHARGPGPARRRAPRSPRRGARTCRCWSRGARGRGRVECGGAAAHRSAPRPRGRAGVAAARACRQGRHLRRGRLLPEAAGGHRAPEGGHGRRRGGARRARRDRRARAAALRSRSPPCLREHAGRRCDPAVGRDHDRRGPHRGGDEPGRRGPVDPRRRALVRTSRARRTSSTSRR